MNVDGTLVMDNFMSMMGNLLVTLGVVGAVTLCGTGLFIYLVHYRGNGHTGE